jgi:CubicO group peptidase (beta-lactamase class C family)
LLDVAERGAGHGIDDAVADEAPTLSRRAVLRRSVEVAALAVAGTVVAGCTADPSASPNPMGGAGGTIASIPTSSSGTSSSAALFAELDAKIEAAMEKFAVPGAAVAVVHDGNEHVRGYGISSVDAPVPVDEHTLFRIGSTTKTYTGTAVMRLVDAGQVDLDAPVRAYVPELAVADEAVAAEVTVRQLLNHTAGWLGDDVEDFGRGEDAIQRYVAGMADQPQLTPLGSTFFYNNAAFVLAGRLVEKVHGTTYEQAVRDLVLDPLDLDETGFFTDELVGRTFAASHDPADGAAVVEPSWWYVPRSLHPTGGLISSARDQLRYLRFHLGGGTGPDGGQVLSPRSLEAMHSNPGPGGTLYVELEGYGVSFQVRPTAEGVPVVQHGGDWPGQRSGFLFVPDRNFGISVLTNSDGGTQLLPELFIDDWALSRFAGVHNLPAEPQRRTAEQLAAYEGRYARDTVLADGSTLTVTNEITAEDGQLRIRAVGPDGTVDLDAPSALAAFYADDFVVYVSGIAARADFVRGPTGDVVWFRNAARLERKIS